MSTLKAYMIIPWLLISLSTSAIPVHMFTASKTAKPGCQQKCGNLTIPYPLGIGPKCSLEGWFSIDCNTSYNPPRAFSVTLFGSSGNPDILDITETQIVVRNSKNQIASNCYDSQSESISTYTSAFDMWGFPFSYSSSSNRFIVIGCDDYAEISAQGTLTDGNQYNFTVGCLALCPNPNEKVIPGSCSGSLCCQTSIPVGLQSFTVTPSRLEYRTALQHCSYAFIAGNDSFTFHGASDLIPNSTVVSRIIEKAPIVLDWSVGVPMSDRPRLNCNEAKKNTSIYACQSNAECIDSEAGGYHCRCLKGYEGNPYLEPGCTDINECAGGSNGLCSMVCANIPGSYKCSCPDGYYGDGLRSGTGCTKIKNNSASFERIILGFGVSLGTILSILGGWLVYVVFTKTKVRKQRAKNFQRNGGLLLQQQMSSDESAVARLKIFSADELHRATDHFNVNRILGKGGQGTVFKGMLSEGKIVAIKKSNVTNESQLGGFINEMVILSQINHRNIVKLLGCCLETEVPLLVYEFIPNGALFNHIHYPSAEFPITWKMRLQIASDSAGALAYLHSSSSTPILHRDIKSSNILLDEKYRAKLSDFGTSKSISIDQTHATTRVMGTFGYLDPEYFQSSMLTEKSDVYSFGVVLVELLTGQKAIRSKSDEDRSLTSWFLFHMQNESLLDIIDFQVLKEGSKEEFLIVANLARQCLNLDGKRRPTMKEVQIEIERVLSLHLPETNRKNWPEAEKVTPGTIKHAYGILSSSTFYLESSTLNSDDLSLLNNPR